MAFNKNDDRPCENNCGHPAVEHHCPYRDINTKREAYKCDHCSCRVYPQQMVGSHPGLIYIEGVGWDYKENAHKYKGNSGSGKRFLGIF